MRSIWARGGGAEGIAPGAVAEALDGPEDRRAAGGALGVTFAHLVGREGGVVAAVLLGVGHRVQGDGGLAAGLGPEQLDDPPLGEPPAPQGQVERDRAGGDPLDLQGRPLAQLHDGAGPERLLDRADRVIQGAFVGRLRLAVGLDRLFLGHDARLPEGTRSLYVRSLI